MANLLDQASIVLTPTAYDNGKVLCAKPIDGSGDFDFSRNSAATRVNAQGLVEDVQILSSNLVQNGSFSQLGSQEITNGNFSQQGSQLITNGDFSNGATGWELTGNADISNGTGNFPGGGGDKIFQRPDLTQGKLYKITFDILNYTSGTSKVYLGSTGDASFTASANGSYSVVLEAEGTTDIIQWRSDSGAPFIGSIDNCSVVEVGQDWILSSQSEIIEDAAKVVSTDGSFQFIKQDGFTSTQGKTIKFTIEITDIQSGQLKVSFAGGATNTNIPNSVGTHTLYIPNDGTIGQLSIGRVSGVTDVTITNISVKEVGQNWDITQSGNDTILIENQYALFDCPDNSNIFITQSSLLTIGKTYKATFDVLSIDNGGFQFAQGGGGTISGSPTINTTGTHTFTFVAATATFGIKRALGAPNLLNAKITNISAIEITDDTNLPRINYEGFSYQDALGSEEITNGDFSNGTNNWQVESSSAIVVGDFKGKTDVAKININNTSTSSRIRQPFNYVNGKTYKVDIEVYVESGNFRSDCSDSFVSGDFVSTSTLGSWQTLTANITAISTGSNYIWLRSISGISEFYISKVSVKEYKGQEVVPDSGCGSWLFEPQSTNLITYSEDFSQWSLRNGGSLVANSVISPDGTQNASSWITNNTGQKLQKNTSGFTQGNEYTFSIYIKADTNLNVGIGGVDSPVVSVAVTTEWQRFEVKQNATSTTRFPQLQNIGNNGTFYIWGAQVEEQTYATSYIPTDGTSVTRNQDVCTNGGSAASINSSEGVLYAEIAALANDLTDRDISISDGTNNNVIRIRLSRFSNNIGYSVLSNGTATVGALVSGQTQTNTNKIAVKYKLNNFSLWINGVEVATDTSGNTPIGLSNLRFSTGNIALPFFGKTKAVAVWEETLTDTELQELTTI